MSLGIGLYVAHSDEAVEAYKAAFGLELGYHVLNDDGKTYFHSELMKDGEEFISVVEASRDIKDCPIQLGYTFETRGELEGALKILAENGKIVMDICELPWSPCAAEVVDRYGIDWYLTLMQHRPADDFKPSDCE